MSDVKVVEETRTETIEGVKELAREYRKHDTPLYIHGPPGVGKSDGIHQLVHEDGVDSKGKPNSGFIDVRVGTMLPEDLTGIPVPDLERKVAVWLRANFWPDADRDGERGIIVFDELSDANRNLQSCIYRVILERQIGEYKLPPGWWPVAAGNRREDRAAAQSISSALANRFAHITVRADAKCWLAWANVNNIDPMLIGFMNTRGDLLHNMAGANLLSFPTPRSWAQASKYFNVQSPNTRFRLIAGCVGEGAAIEVETFFKVVELPDFEDIVKTPMKAMIPTQPASRYAVAALLARNLARDNFVPVLKYINRDEFGADFATVVVLDATKRDASLCDTPTFIEWARKNKSLRL
jgi:hypothetical protein